MFFFLRFVPFCMALPHFITFSGFFWRHIASTLAGLIDEARPFLCSALCVLSLVACSHRSLCVCVCVCFFCSSLLSSLPFFPVSFLLPFLSWPSFFRSFLLLRSGGVPLFCVGFCSPATLSAFFFWLLFPPPWGYARGSRQPLFTGICPPDCRWLPVFASPASARWLVFLSSQ